jgi:hypothetical protein
MNVRRRVSHDLFPGHRPAEALYAHGRPRRPTDHPYQSTGHVLTLDDALHETLPALLSLLEAQPREFAFQHALTPNAALGSMRLARRRISRRAAHGRVADQAHGIMILEVVDSAANHIATQGVCRQAARDHPLGMRRQHSSTIVTHPPFASMSPLPPNF